MDILVDEIGEGMILAEAICERGSVLLEAGIPLTAQHRKILKKRGILTVTVEVEGEESRVEIDASTREEAARIYHDRLFNYARHYLEEVIDKLAIEHLAHRLALKKRGYR